VFSFDKLALQARKEAPYDSIIPDPREAAAKTKGLMADSSASVIFEAAFIAEQF
jgi:hypothetical protein